MKVASIYRYPIKSMMGEDLPVAELGTRGVLGDRAWAVRDEVRGGIQGGKRIASLMKLSATYTATASEDGSAEARIVTEDGEEVLTSDPAVGEWLSAKLDWQVELWPLQPESNEEHYRRNAPGDDPIAEVRAVMGRTDDEPLPDFSRFPSELAKYSSPLGTYFDAYPLLIMSRESLRSLAERAPDTTIDVRRFRPNIVLEGVASEHPFPESQWEGRRMQIGRAVVEATIGCPRCVMITRDFADLPNEPKIMRRLVEETNGDLGIYAQVVEPGRIAVGDSATLLP